MTTRISKTDWFVYFPLLRDVFGPVTEAEAKEEAGKVGIVMGPFWPKGGESVKAKKTKEIIHHMLKELQRPAARLTNWELGFLDNVNSQFEERHSLSDRQFEILERIYAERAQHE